jgi:hypothetical protein
MSTINERLVPQDAPFNATVSPRGLDRVLTAPEVTAANTLYPKPPNGFTVWNTATGAAKP